MLEVFHNSNFRMMWRTKWVFLSISAAAILLAAGAMLFRGFNYGIDFAGGTAVQLMFREPPRIEELRAALNAARIGDISVQRIGDSDKELLIRVEQTEMRDGRATSDEGGEIGSLVLRILRSGEAERGGRLDLNTVSEASLRDWLAARLPAGGGDTLAADAGVSAAAVIRMRNNRGGLFVSSDDVLAVPGLPPAASRLLQEETVLGDIALRGIEFVGPTAGAELLRNTRRAVIGAVVSILLYVWIRFHRFAWGVAAVVSLVHDVIIAAGAMALTGKEFSLTVVAALLTVLGYSINDTIVVFDRIRENLRLYRDHDFEEVVNASINQTLSRTVLTSFTTFIAVTALYFFGGDKLNPMAFCLMVGLIAGSYSTIFIACALLAVAHRHLGRGYVMRTIDRAA